MTAHISLIRGKTGAPYSCSIRLFQQPAKAATASGEETNKDQTTPK